MNISQLKKKATELLNGMQKGKEYPIRYVYDRVAFAAEKHNNDILLNTMRDVLEKKASSQNFISQEEVSDLYNSLYNYSGSHSEFRNELGDLLKPGFGMGKKAKYDASGSRENMEKFLEPLQDSRKDLNKLAQELSSVFSLNPKGSFSELNSDSFKKAEKFTKLQLKAMGCEPREVKAVRSNDHFILCVASYPNAKNQEISLKVPVQLNGATPTLPTYFIDDGELSKLSQSNVLVYLKNNENVITKSAKRQFQDLRSNKSLEINRLDHANKIAKWANLEQDLIESTSKYDKNIVRLASSLLDMELKSFNVNNPQVRLKSAFDRGLNYDVSINSPLGAINLEIPVEIVSGQPIMPIKFKYANDSYEFSKRGFNSMTRGMTKSASFIPKVSEDMDLMNYNQLMDVMISSASNGDFKGAEDVLISIQNKYSGQSVLNAISKYSSLLKHNSKNSERELFIKEALNRGDLIRTSTSFDLYSPKYGKYLSKLSFDVDGNLVPKYRFKNENLKESEGLNITTSQIKLT